MHGWKCEQRLGHPFSLGGNGHRNENDCGNHLEIDRDDEELHIRLTSELPTVQGKEGSDQIPEGGMW